MEKMFVLSPSGTSLLTNQANHDERKLVGKYANTKQLHQIPVEDQVILQALASRVEETIAQTDQTLAARLSAELNGIIKLYKGQWQRQLDYHVLLCTDTWLGETTAQLVGVWLRSQGLMVEVKRQDDLQTEDIERFQWALSELVGWCQEIVSGYRTAGYQVVFNLTGGFKSVQGFLQTLATFYADETIYIFETATELLRIPRLPVQMTAEDTVRQHLTSFRRLSMGLSVKEIASIPETLLMRDHEIFSPWGELVWEQTKPKLYGDRLYPSPGDRLRYGEKFAASVHNLPPDRMMLINKRIDQLVRHLETGKSNVASLDFKQLKGNPCPPSTHEVDAWADQDAKRLFGHFEGATFVLDKLDRGLH
jgi:putative CRISPR-associated protein (TIGR02619 family)